MFEENQIRITKGLNIDFDLEEFKSDFVVFNEANSYILYYKDVLYGFYNTMKIERENLIEIQYSLIRSFRGNSIGQDFLNKVIDIVSKENSDIEKIVLMINDKNLISKKIASKEGFNIDFGIMEQLEEEITELVPYSKSNEYYKNKKLCLQK